MWGISNVSRTTSPNSRFLTLAVVAAFALALGACGRKTGLDPPPSAAAPNATPTTEMTDPNAPPPGSKNSAAASQQLLYNSGNPADRSQYAPKLPPKRIAIDPILD
jgi:predicted small lipoprotein YifL